MTFTQDWLNTKDIIPHWERILIPMSDKPLSMLEIGCFEGRSTLWFLQNILRHKDSRITVVDTFKGDTQQKAMGVETEGMRERFSENVKDYSKVSVWEGDSKEILKTMDDEFDIIYIDGSHYQIDVLRDMVLSFDLLKLGGVMICDDYRMVFNSDDVYNKPAIAIEAFESVYNPKITVLHKGWQVILRREK